MPFLYLLPSTALCATLTPAPSSASSVPGTPFDPSHYVPFSRGSRGFPDGLKIDAARNIWTTGRGLRTLTHVGRVFGQLRLPESRRQPRLGRSKRLHAVHQGHLAHVPPANPHFSATCPSFTGNEGNLLSGPRQHRLPAAHHLGAVMNRRTFTRLSVLAATCSAVPLSAQTQPPLRFACVGLGRICDIFMKACAQSTKARVTGLVTGHAGQKAPKYQALYGIPSRSVYSYDDFDRIASDPDIDAVYIGLPNSMHAEYTIRAAKAGKHVLCEKPMAISSAECRAMIAACRKADVKLMIAYRVHYDPIWISVRNMTRSGAIGDVQGFQGGFYGNEKLGEWRLDKKLAGGGSLFDLGIYPLNAARWIAGEEPSSFTAQVATKVPDPRFATVEETVEFTMKFPSSILASSGSSYGESGPNYLQIDGTKGYLRVDNAFVYQGVNYTGRTVNGPVDFTSPGKEPYQFIAEADHFADCVHNNTRPLTPGEEGLADLLAIEAIYRAAGAPLS